MTKEKALGMTYNVILNEVKNPYDRVKGLKKRARFFVALRMTRKKRNDKKKTE